MWALSLFAGVRRIWIERNNGLFENKSAEVEVVVVVDSIVWMASVWASRGKDSEGVPLQDTYQSWEAVFQGSRKGKEVVSAIWVHPPIGVLKPKFDGSFLKDRRQGWSYKG